MPKSWPTKPRFADAGGPPGPPVQWNKKDLTSDNSQAGDGYTNSTTTPENEEYFYHPDHLGSTSYITDHNGGVMQFASYLPYGEALADEHTVTETQPYKFSGKELDGETGLYYFGARYYNPKFALWYGVDPLAEKKPWVTGYAYCLNNPVRYIDPTGLYEEESQAAKEAEKRGAKYFQDKPSGHWFIAMDENGKKPYTTGGTMKRDFGTRGEDYSTVATALTIGGAFSSTWQYSQYSKTLGIWTGKDGKIHHGLKGKGPNKATGPRSSAKAKSGRIGVGSSLITIAGITITELQYANDMKQNPGSNMKHYLGGRRIRDQLFNGSGFGGIYGAAASFGYNLGYMIEGITGFNIQYNPITNDFTPIEETLKSLDEAGVYIY